ncbi:response regulator transcription factor [Ruegeria conchae]|uniref:response regulator transcription factor n=1 Tax=Ruegeria conchae TaxID=981384 RepID=UPI0029C9AE61|nr:response regulator transcription factor [Ruegeria conchae]
MKILLADDHDLVREAIAAFLVNEGEADVVVTGSLPEAINEVKQKGPFDLVLLDYNMPGMNGLDGLRKMISISDKRPVALLSGTTTRALAEEAISEGAAGFVPKTLGSKSMISAARFMAAGEIYAPFNLMQKREQQTSDLLSKRELDVLQGICRGQANKEIARDFNIHEATVKLHAKTLCRKLGARNRTHAAMIARDRNLL